MSSTERKTDPRPLHSSVDERDRAIFHSLVEHKVLTTKQLHVLFFRSLRRCQHRLKELKEIRLLDSFEPRQVFGKGRLPEHHYLTELGASVLAQRVHIPRGELPWIPDATYEENRNLRHRMGLNAFFCSLVEASFCHEGHGLRRWRPEHRVRTKAGEIQPDGFGRYLHPGGACEFYFEYDRGTEGATALAEKLRGYRAFATGWGEGAAFPNLLLLVPTQHREREVARAWDRAGRETRTEVAVSVFVSNERLLATRGMLGPVWLPIESDGERLCLTELPTTDASPYEIDLCLGRYWADSDEWSRISPTSWAARFPPGAPGRRS